MPLLNTNDADETGDVDTEFHFPTSKEALIIFTRNPELGKCKTRLAKTVGDESALKIYKFLLQHTVAITTKLKADKYVYYSEKVHNGDLWDTNTFRKKLQHGDDLGIRMRQAFNEVFMAGYDKAIIIGSDMYDLNQHDIETAFAALNDNEVVIGPAEDGGYYLLGMSSLQSKVFSNKDWGKETVLKDTLADLTEVSVKHLEERNDVDYYEDIEDQEIFQQFFPKHLKKDTK